MKDYAKKYYHVIFCDEYDNWYFIGKFTNLRDAEPELNEMLKDTKVFEDNINTLGKPAQFGDYDDEHVLGHLVERAGTMGPVFDVEIGTECGCCRVGGYISEELDLAEILRDLAKGHIEEGYRLDEASCKIAEPFLKLAQGKEAYKEFGMGDAYNNVADVLENPEILDLKKPLDLVKVQKILNRTGE